MRMDCADISPHAITNARVSVSSCRRLVVKVLATECIVTCPRRTKREERTIHAEAPHGGEDCQDKDKVQRVGINIIVSQECLYEPAS